VFLHNEFTKSDSLHYPSPFQNQKQPISDAPLLPQKRHGIRSLLYFRGAVCPTAQTRNFLQHDSTIVAYQKLLLLHQTFQLHTCDLSYIKARLYKMSSYFEALLLRLRNCYSKAGKNSTLCPNKPVQRSVQGWYIIQKNSCPRTRHLNTDIFYQLVYLLK
jgi:hypothetical protein